MEVQTCSKCGRLFNWVGIGPRLCPFCKEREEEIFKTVKNYLWDHKGANMKEVMENCGATEKQIKQWIREQRIEFAKESGVTVDCERCGKPILSGKMCADCRKQMEQEIKALSTGEELPVKKKPRGRDRMFFIHDEG